MKTTYTLNQTELSQVVADYIARKMGHEVKVDVSFTVSANYSYDDRPTGSHTITANASVDDTPSKPHNASLASQIAAVEAGNVVER